MGTTSSNNAQRLLDPHQDILPRGKRTERKRTEGYGTTAVKTVDNKEQLPAIHRDDIINHLPGTDLYTSPSGLYTIRLYQTHFAAEVVGPLGKSVVDPGHHHVINTFLEKYKILARYFGLEPVIGSNSPTPGTKHTPIRPLQKQTGRQLAMTMTSPIVLSFIPESAAPTYLHLTNENSVGNSVSNNGGKAKTASLSQFATSNRNNNNSNNNDSSLSSNYRYQLRRPSVKCGDELWPQGVSAPRTHLPGGLEVCSFVLPLHMTRMDAAPCPVDPLVRLHHTPNRCVAAIAFTGKYEYAVARRYISILTRALVADGLWPLQEDDEVVWSVAMFEYTPSKGILPGKRYNEVWIELDVGQFAPLLQDLNTGLGQGINIRRDVGHEEMPLQMTPSHEAHENDDDGDHDYIAYDGDDYITHPMDTTTTPPPPSIRSPPLPPLPTLPPPPLSPPPPLFPVPPEVSPPLPLVLLPPPPIAALQPIVVATLSPPSFAMSPPLSPPPPPLSSLSPPLSPPLTPPPPPPPPPSSLSLSPPPLSPPPLSPPLSPPSPHLSLPFTPSPPRTPPPRPPPPLLQPTSV